MERFRYLDLRDPRGTDRFLRFSWHEARRAVIVSQWREGSCISTTPVGVEHLAKIGQFVIGVLDEAATLPPEERVGNNAPPGPSRIGNWLRPRVAPVVTVALHRAAEWSNRRRSA